MTSNSIFSRDEIGARWRAIDPAWRWAVGVFIGARIFYTVWSAVILLLVPALLQNPDLFGAPVVASFDMQTGERQVYSRVVNGETLTFRRVDETHISDTETGSLWELGTGRAVSGKFEGASLARGIYTEEDLFPYRGVQPAAAPLLGIWQRFDTNWFLEIAERGYASEDGSTVYLPLYPLLIRVVGTVLLGNDLLAALLISNLALVVALYLLYRFTNELFDENTARRALVFLALFPTGFFFFAAYTEALFLALALASLYAGRRNNFGWAAVWGMLAALTRLQGVLIFVPLAYMVWDQVGERKLRLTARTARAFAALLLIPLATAGFLAYANLSLLASYEGELHARFVLPWENVWAAVQLILAGGAGIADIANLVATILFGALCVVVWRKLPRALALYTALMFVAPLFRMTTTQPLVSMTRYVLVLFPAFMLLAYWSKNGWVERAVVYVSLPLALFFTAQFLIWGWVA